MKTVVYTFGRFNPVSRGHENLFTAMSQIRANYSIIYPSVKENTKSNPLDFDTKIKYLKKAAYLAVNEVSTDKSINDAFQATEKLAEKGFEKFIFVVGSDRIEEMNKKLKRWFDKTYPSKSLEIVCADDRSNCKHKEKEISASLMRQAVIDSDFESFFEMCPIMLTSRERQKLFLDVEKSLNSL